jgi:hypothetical protein
VVAVAPKSDDDAGVKIRDSDLEDMVADPFTSDNYYSLDKSNFR